jgi:spore coat protein U-like protein
MKKYLLMLGLCNLVALISTAHAQSDTGVLEVNTTVGNSCSIDAMATIDFGVYDPDSISTSTTGSSLNITCNGPAVAWRIHSPQSVVTRLLVRNGGTETLSYTLTNSTDTAFAVTDVAAGQERGIGTGTGIIKGAMAAGQNVIPGTYSQQIQLSLMF